MKKIYTVSLTEFVRRFPVFKTNFSNLLSDSEYIVKYQLNSNGKLYCFELGYEEDYFAIEHR